MRILRTKRVILAAVAAAALALGGVALHPAQQARAEDNPSGTVVRVTVIGGTIWTCYYTDGKLQYCDIKFAGGTKVAPR